MTRPTQHSAVQEPRPGGRTPDQPIQVIIGCAVRFYSDGLAGALRQDHGHLLQVVGCAPDTPGTLALAADHLPDVILLDISMEGAVEAVRTLRGTPSAPRVVVLAVDELDDELLACVRAGVSGYVARDASLDDLIRTVRSAACGEVLCSPRFAAHLFDHVVELADQAAAAPPADSTSGRLEQLTPRQHEILQLIARGMSNKEIARRLSIRVPTVKNHVHQVLDKLNVSRRGAAAVLVGLAAGGEDGESAGLQREGSRYRSRAM
jgi:two-component system, NarL family, nitrate/nitrite response regulator NarL